MDWQLADAKNRFSEVVNRALSEGPQRVRRRNEAVIVLSEKDFLQLTGEQPSLIDYLLEGPDISDLDLQRSSDPGREVEL